MQTRAETAVTTGEAIGRAPVIVASGVTKEFTRAGRSVLALSNVDLTVHQGQFVCLVGPSGCGKSTLLNMLAGLIPVTAGAVRYRGERVERPLTQLGYITQKDNLMPWRTAAKNIALGLEIRGVPKAQRQGRVEDMIRLVGLEGFGDAYPSELSGGMRKRVALARTLIYEPETLLADEPFGALDAHLRLVMQQELLRIWAETNTTVVFVTHDLPEAIALADDVYVFGAQPGRIVYHHEIDIPRPRDVFELRMSEHFERIHREIWARLGGEIRSVTTG